jgi:hypothetical protein
MIDKKRGYYLNRPFYDVDTSVHIQAGMVAFLGTNAAGTIVATTAASGTVPIGTFWKDSDTSYVRTTAEQHTFNSSGMFTLNGGNVLSTAFIKVTNVAGTTTYNHGVDYSVFTANGVVTTLPGGALGDGSIVVVTYRYTVATGREFWDKVSTQWSTGQNYDRQANDTLGSGLITVVEGDAKIFTDQYDPVQTYTLNAPLYSNATSLWTTVAGLTSICGRVIHPPTSADPFLGLDQIRVGS